jgi:hypothetical protein
MVRVRSATCQCICGNGRLRVMRRRAATGLLEELLLRATATDRLAHDPVLEVVSKMAVYGSYARGKPDPGHVDVHVTTTLDADRRALWHMPQMSPYWNYQTLRTALRGRRRLVHVEFDDADIEHLDPCVLLWRSGEPRELALERLNTVAERTADGEDREPTRPTIALILQPLSRQVRQPTLAALTAYAAAGAITNHRTHPARRRNRSGRHRPRPAPISSRAPDAPCRRGGAQTRRVCRTSPRPHGSHPNP